MNILMGNEYLVFDDAPINKLLSDFWAWNCSDLLNNTMRGAFAEFIIASALEIDMSSSRIDWDAFDLLWQGIRIEVKSSAYLQSWEQRGPSRIVFSIREAHELTTGAWDAATIRRHSDVYAFCVFNCLDRAVADPLNLDQWDFYIVPTKTIDSTLGAQKTISLPALLRLSPVKCDFDGIASAIEEASSKTLFSTATE